MSKTNGEKGNGVEREKRVNIIYTLAVRGTSRHDIIRYVDEKTDWKLSSRQIDRYLARAKEMMAEQAAYVREVEFGLARIRYNDLFSKSYELHDYKTALAVQKELCALLALAAIDETSTRSLEAVERLLERIDQTTPEPETEPGLD